MHGPLVPAKDVDDFIILRLRAFTAKARHLVIQRILVDEGLALLEWHLIFSVARFGTTHLAHITRNTSIDPAHGSRAATALEKKGLIERYDDPDNRRRKLISLTQEGRATFERVWPRAQALIGTVADKLSADDFEELKRLLDLANLAIAELSDTIETKGDDAAEQTRQIA